MKKIRKIGVLLTTTLVLSACSTGISNNDQTSVVVTDSSSVTRHDAGDSSTVLEKNSETSTKNQEKVTSQENETTAEESATSSSSEESSMDISAPIEEVTTESASQKLYHQAQGEYNAGHYDAAAGTLSTFLQQYGPHTEAQSLLEEVNQQRLHSSKTTEPTEYALERQSEVIQEKYLTDTSKSISTATDEEIAAWKENSGVSTHTSEASPTEVDIHEEVLSILGPEATEYNYIISELGEGIYQVEVRQDQAVADENISNLIGLFRYNTTDGSVQKQNVVTGEFETFVQ